MKDQGKKLEIDPWHRPYITPAAEALMERRLRGEISDDEYLLRTLDLVKREGEERRVRGEPEPEPDVFEVGEYYQPPGGPSAEEFGAELTVRAEQFQAELVARIAERAGGPHDELLLLAERLFPKVKIPRR